MQFYEKQFGTMSLAEIELIFNSALKILEEMGMVIENNDLLSRLADIGLPVSKNTQTVRFPKNWVENWIADAEKTDWENKKPQISASAGIYHGRYHDPKTNTLTHWTYENLQYYFSLARKLPYVSNAVLLGNRLGGLPVLEPLYERYYAWKFGGQEAGSICLDELCEPLFDLYMLASQFLHKPIDQLFRAVVFVIPALKLGQHEAYQVAYFLKRGLHVEIGGSLFSLGANAPVTLAGAITLNLAEQLALRILDDAFFGKRKLWIGVSIAPMDMRTLIRPFGRPEMAKANFMTAQIARYLGAGFFGHAGLTDAKFPSVEAGYQKAFSALPTLIASGNFWMDVGLLAIDEVCSPVQMVLDNEFLSALNHFSIQQLVNDDTIGLETILRIGPGGNYTAEEHTFKNFRTSLWQPKIWSREMLNVWEEAGSKIDADLAREFSLSIQTDSPFIDESFDNELIRLLKSYERKFT